jgi:hypothetical protein
MEHLNQEFNKIKHSNNPAIINDFLIRLSENPKEEFLKFLDFIINETEESIYEKIKLNLVFVLGEIGSIVELPDKFLVKLVDIYYSSDRWIRNETIQTFKKISLQSKLNENIISLLGKALNDDYLLVKLSTLEVLLNFKVFPNSIFRNFFQVLNSKDSEILDFCRRVLEQVSLDTQSIFKSLDISENYKILKPRAIRLLLLIKFKSLFNLEPFREKIFNAGWEDSFKEKYLTEIDNFQRILIKNM